MVCALHYCLVGQSRLPSMARMPFVVNKDCLKVFWSSSIVSQSARRLFDQIFEVCHCLFGSQVGNNICYGYLAPFAKELSPSALGSKYVNLLRRMYKVIWTLTLNVSYSSWFPHIPCSLTKMPALVQFRLPDPLARWPWPRALNPHYAEVKSESEAWLRGFEALDIKSQRAFDRCNLGKYIFENPSIVNITSMTLSPPRWPCLSTYRQVSVPPKLS